MLGLTAFFIFCTGMFLFMMKKAFENHVVRHEIPIEGKKEKFTIFFISDIHTRSINKKMIQNIKEPIHAVIIGGDLADKRTPISKIYRNLRLLQSLAPVYFVWGNNDREVGEERLRKIFQETGVQIVENDAVLLPGMVNRCWLSAVDDVSTSNARPELAFKKCRPQDKVIFVSHNPVLFSSMKNFHADVCLGGHYHGGQIRLGPFGIYPKGSLTVQEGTYILVSNGYGTTMLPLRLGAKPECHIICLNFRSSY
ncbi:metallophosphoesterase [Ureibacillus sp. FSL K6-8385]|uniref:Serine/threonine protein phosphatase n=1 Tax=Ureibacillus terrenus TaxID=118246 RepID=A0A540V6L7_9BACL|nr:metallophosphoesterase [Ureibacillus terrenus]MED3660610.1 metallophosphoesterase [Ureibacillus terrenus]MED3762730.1 metallophosphoesterase [Ureibacillus terrenus]TQE92396.1 serine/threonine protein phosphatase [Ureibacillus terrenus]